MMPDSRPPCDARVLVTLRPPVTCRTFRHRIIRRGVDQMRTRMSAFVAVAVLSIGGAKASAQSRFDVGLLLGSTSATDEGAVLQFDRATTYQATFAWHVWRAPAANFSVEVPFIASPAFTVATRAASLPLEYASLYLTPGIRVTIAARAPVSFF